MTFGEFVQKCRDSGVLDSDHIDYMDFSELSNHPIEIRRDEGEPDEGGEAFHHLIIQN